MLVLKAIAFSLLYVASQLLLAVRSQPWWTPLAQLGAFSPNSEIYVLSHSAVKPVCSQLQGLSSGQARICELFIDHMPAVASGARQGIDECRHHFRDRRWNCSSAYGPGTREAAFQFAVVAAGITHQIGRSCRNGDLSTCACSNDKRPNDLHPDWKWGGCGDNIDYGYEFASNFIDIRERERTFPIKSPDYGRSLMNRWNNEIGRKIVKKYARVQCKCHGVSGSCNLKTCWKQLAPLREVAEHLVEKYDTAVQVRINKRGNMQVIDKSFTSVRVAPGDARQKRGQKKAPKMDLVFIDESPDYCRANSTIGTPGTQGRLCRRDSDGMDSCDLLCCGRGYNTYKKAVSEKCSCKFQWCCEVVCKTCHTQVETHMCK